MIFTPTKWLISYLPNNWLLGVSELAIPELPLSELNPPRIAASLSAIESSLDSYWLFACLSVLSKWRSFIDFSVSKLFVRCMFTSISESSASSYIKSVMKKSNTSIFETPSKIVWFKDLMVLYLKYTIIIFDFGLRLLWNHPQCKYKKGGGGGRQGLGSSHNCLHNWKEYLKKIENFIKLVENFRIPQ